MGSGPGVYGAASCPPPRLVAGSLCRSLWKDEATQLSCVVGFKQDGLWSQKCWSQATLLLVLDKALALLGSLFLLSCTGLVATISKGKRGSQHSLHAWECLLSAAAGGPGRGLTELKSRCQQGCIPFQSLQGRICFLAFSSFYRLSTFLGSWPISPTFKGRNITSPSTLSQEKLSTLKNPLGDVGTTPLVQDNLHLRIFNFITSVKFFGRVRCDSHRLPRAGVHMPATVGEALFHSITDQERFVMNL